MIPKNRIQLSKTLRAQTTPYPEAHRWLRRGVFLLILVLAAGIYLWAKPGGQTQTPAEDQQILGGQESIPEARFSVYRVQPGDTLFNLSQRFDVSWQILAELNGLDEPYLLRVGQSLKIPENE